MKLSLSALSTYILQNQGGSGYTVNAAYVAQWLKDEKLFRIGFLHQMV